jgi:preprotein translocase SecE subunit
MPEDTETPETQPETAETRTKRRLRANSETVRERTQRLSDTTEAKLQKQAAGGGKSGAFRTFVRGFTWPLRKLGRGIASLNRFKVFRIIGHILYPKYFRNSVRELRLVTWPNRSTSWRLTYAVIIFSLIFGVIIAIVDFALDKLFKEFIIK